MKEYQVLYRKYRPIVFGDVYGQEYIITALQNAIINDKVNHAYIFSGHRGTGKTTIAKIYAKNINCENSIDGVACEKCKSCELININKCSDIFEIDAASNNGIDEIRELISNVSYMPMLLKKKIYIIDEVHMLSKGAFNVFLKTLEEPPKHVVFILATTEPEKIPITIMSRCQRFDFLRITNKEIEKRIKEIVNIEKILIDEKSLKFIIRLADGSLRDALNILDKVNIFSNNKINFEKTIQALGILSLNLKREIVEHLIDSNREKIINLSDKINEKGINISNILVDLLYLFRDLLILKVTGNNKKVTYYEDWMLVVSDKLSEEELVKIIFEINKMIVQVKNLNNATLFFEILLLKISLIRVNSNKVLLQENNQIDKIVYKEESKKLNTENIKIKKQKNNKEKIDIYNNIDEEKNIIDIKIFQSELFEILNMATKEKKVNCVKILFKMQEKATQNNKFALAKFFESTVCVAASKTGIILILDKKIFIEFEKRLNDIKKTIQTGIEVNEIIIISEDIWNKERKLYVNNHVEKKNLIEEEKSDFEKTMELHFKDKFEQQK